MSFLEAKLALEDKHAAGLLALSQSLKIATESAADKLGKEELEDEGEGIAGWLGKMISKEEDATKEGPRKDSVTPPSLKTLLKEIVECTMLEADAHKRKAENVRCTVLKPMQGFQKRSLEDTTSLSHALDTPTLALSNGIANCDKGRNESHRLCREAEDAEAKADELLGMGRGEALLEALHPSSMLAKLKKAGTSGANLDPEKLRAQAAACQSAYKEQVQRTKILQDLYFDCKLPNALDASQAQWLSRYRELSSYLSQMVTCDEASCKELVMINLRARHSVKKVNVVADVDDLLEDAEGIKPNAVLRVPLGFQPDPREDWGNAKHEEETGD